MISAFRSRHGASNWLLGLVAGRGLAPLAAPALFPEYEKVSRRPEQREVPGLILAQVDAALAALAAALEPVKVHFAWRPQLPDPGGEVVLDAAANGQADAPITHNVTHLAQAATRSGFTLLRPCEFLKRMRR